MRPAEVVRRGAAYLACHDVQSPEVAAEQLMMFVLRTDRTGLYTRTEGLDAAETKAYGRALCRRCVGTPLQHLLGTTGFRGLELIVRPGVFVPRPETEVLVDVALEMLVDVPEPVVADVGTGTGAVALAIAQERDDAVVHATDISADAVALANQNAERLGLGIVARRGSLLESLPELPRLDLVVSNPPYVPAEEEPGLPLEVLAEPREAVFGGPGIYRDLFEQAVWRRAAMVVVEIHENAGVVVSEMAAAAGFTDVRVRTDLAGRDRVVGARRP